VVSYQGKPVPFGMIKFVSKSNPALQDQAPIKSDGTGTYSLTNAPLGRVKVVLIINGAYDAQAYEQLGKAKPADVLPAELNAKYANPDTTPLEATVELGERTLNFEIKP
jgi:hypothetical protein